MNRFTAEWWYNFLTELGYTKTLPNHTGFYKSVVWPSYQYGNYEFHPYRDCVGNKDHLFFEVRYIDSDLTGFAITAKFWGSSSENGDLVEEMIDLDKAIVDPTLAPLLVKHPAKRIVANLLRTG